MEAFMTAQVRRYPGWISYEFECLFQDTDIKFFMDERGGVMDAIAQALPNTNAEHPFGREAAEALYEGLMDATGAQ
jgi:hypothetical protein